MTDYTEMRTYALDIATDLAAMGQCDRTVVETIKTCCYNCLVEIVVELID